MKAGLASSYLICHPRS